MLNKKNIYICINFVIYMYIIILFLYKIILGKEVSRNIVLFTVYIKE